MKWCTNGQSVTVDVVALLRIAKHAKQTFKESQQQCCGSLLGIDLNDKNLTVTNCFPYKSHKDVSTMPMMSFEATGQEIDSTEYQYEVINAVREVRGDANPCGWYECSSHGSFLSDSLVDNQYSFQKEVPNAVVIIYDPTKLKNGKTGFQAYRLSDAAFQKRRQADENEDDDAFEKFPSDLLFEQVPIRVHCSPQVETLLLNYSTDSSAANFKQSLDTDKIGESLERNVQLLLESLDEFSMQQREMQMYERQTRNAKKEQQQKNQRVPKALDTLNLSQQIQQHCATIHEASADSLGKLYMVSQGANIHNVINSLGGA